VAEDVALFPQLFHASFWASENGVLVYRTGASDTPKLTWLGRDGKRLSDSGSDEFSTYVRLSPDASKAVVEIADSTNGNIDIWSWDFVRGLKTRRTFDPKPDRSPAWSPDGRQIAFSSAKSGVFQIYRRNLDGGEEEQLTSGPSPKWVSDWSRDGRYILFDDGGYVASEDIWAVQVGGKNGKNSEPFVVMKTPFSESNAALSPDGKWVAYNSIDTGRPEIYVQAFEPERSAGAAPGPRWQISTSGGRQPRWRGDGKELFFVGLDGSRIMAATIRTTPSGVESDNPQQLFVLPIMLEVRSPYDVTADGQRFLVLERTISRATPLAIVLNWQEALAK
jgi:Tol biopolymer transport system component